MTRQRWAIIGGGFLGLTLAHRLAAAGQTVTVFEAGPRIGGLAGAWRIGDVVWDRFYHVIMLSDGHLRGLLAELDLDRTIAWKTTGTRFFVDGALHPMDNALDYLRFPALGLPAKLRLAATIVCASRIEEAGALDRVSALDWLRRWSGEEAVDRIWRPLLRAKLGDMAEEVSASFIWAVVRRLYAARRSGLKVERFGYVPGGYATVLARFAERLAVEGVELATNEPVRCVERLGGGVRVATPNGERPFDRVVITAPAPIAARLCPQFGWTERARLAQIPYMGVVCASALLKRPLTGAYLTYIADPSVALTAIVEMTGLVDPRQLGGHHLAYLPRYVGSEGEWFARSDEEIKRHSIDGLIRLFPDLRESDIIAVRIARARHVLPLPRVGQAGRRPPMATSIPSVYLVNSSHILNGTLNLNETVRLADEASAMLLNAPAESRLEAAE
jgi:protoporphyrinogen oxidase